MTRERGSRAEELNPESKNCEILLLPTADRRFDTKVKCPTGRASISPVRSTFLPKKRRLDVWVAKHVCDINFQLKSLQRFWWPEMPSDDYHWQAHMYGVQCPPKFNFWILLVLLAFDVVVLQFLLTFAIQHSSFQFLFSNWRFDIVCFTIQHPSLRNSTSKFIIQHPSLCTIQHPSLRKFNIQLWKISNRNPVNDSQCGLRKLSKFSLCRG